MSSSRQSSGKNKLQYGDITACVQTLKLLIWRDWTFTKTPSSKHSAGKNKLQYGDTSACFKTLKLLMWRNTNLKKHTILQAKLWEEHTAICWYHCIFQDLTLRESTWNNCGPFAKYTWNICRIYTCHICGIFTIYIYIYME